MNGENQQEDMSMEDILSSIKDILNNDEENTKESNPSQVSSASDSKENEISLEESLSQSLVKEDSSDDDVYDLSKSMIINEPLPQDLAADKLFEDELDETGPVFDIDDENAEDVKLPEVSSKDDADFSLDLPEDDAFPLLDDDEEKTPEIKQEQPQEDEISLDVVLNAANNALAEDVAVEEPQAEVLAQEPAEEDNEKIKEEISRELESLKQEQAQVSFEKEVKAEEPVKAQAEDATDVSADIISNFAKMFAEKAPQQEEVAYEEEKVEQPKENINLIGDGSKTIEDVVKDAIKEIVMANVNAEMTKNVDIVSLAKEEIRAQAKAWIAQNLPAIVNAAVKEEMERVMAKVGK